MYHLTITIWTATITTRIISYQHRYSDILRGIVPLFDALDIQSSIRRSVATRDYEPFTIITYEEFLLHGIGIHAMYLKAEKATFTSAELILLVDFDRKIY